MSEKKHPALNTISIVDRFRVKAFSPAQNVHYVFQAHGDYDHARATFTCHLYDTGSHEHPAYVEVDTFGTDRNGTTRCFGTGRTLEELVHNLDWAHKPSELALLKALLSTRVTTNDGTPLGDTVFRRLSQEEQTLRDQHLKEHAMRRAQEQAAQLTRLFESALHEVTQAAATAGSFGLRQDVELNIGALKP